MMIIRSRIASFIIPSRHVSSSLRHFSTEPQQLKNQTPPEEDLLSTIPKTLRTKTPTETQFETWTQRLKPGHFTPSDVDSALRAQSDPSLALDIFRWTAQQRHYTHDSTTYLTIIRIMVSARHHRHAEAISEEVISGACEPSLPLYNTIIKFLCTRKLLFQRAFDVYKKMLNSENDECRPTLETYTVLLSCLLRRFDKIGKVNNVCYVYLHSVKSLVRQMKAVGVIPDVFVLNMIVKAYAKCLEIDQAVRVTREMGLYGCEPNAYTYGYLIKGACEKGRVGQGLGFYKETTGKGMVPQSSGCYMILVCSLALDRRFGDAVEVVNDMLGEKLGPDFLTYKTVLEGLCREGKGEEAFGLLEEWRKRDFRMGDRNYRLLLDVLHFENQE